MTTMKFLKTILNYVYVVLIRIKCKGEFRYFSFVRKGFLELLKGRFEITEGDSASKQLTNIKSQLSELIF